MTGASAVWESLAASLRVQPFEGRTLEESVLAHLAPKRALLVLDNCEHLLDAVARQVDAVLRRCPRVAVLATSREGLALAGERIVAVPSLTLPDEGAEAHELMRADAGRLFVERASATRPDFTLTESNASHRLCHQWSPTRTDCMDATTPDGMTVRLESTRARSTGLNGRLSRSFDAANARNRIVQGPPRL